MITVRLWWFYLTYKGIKTAEIRKQRPKNFQGNVYEYVSKTNWKQDLMKIPAEERDFFKQFIGKVGLKFTLNKVEKFLLEDLDDYNNDNIFIAGSCLTVGEMRNYFNHILGEDGYGYAWHIDNLEIFDKPKELGEFYFAKTDKLPRYLYPLTRVPQSWCYIEV